MAIEPEAVYCCANGPRFETKAEISMMGRLGGHVVGMTGYPEVALAVETRPALRVIALVSNPPAGVGPALRCRSAAIIDALEQRAPASSTA